MNSKNDPQKMTKGEEPGLFYHCLMATITHKRGSCMQEEITSYNSSKSEIICRLGSSRCYIPQGTLKQALTYPSGPVKNFRNKRVVLKKQRIMKKLV